MTREDHEQRGRGWEYSGLHVLADDDPRWLLDPVAQARAACRGGAPVIQLRAKRATDQQVLAWAREIRWITRESSGRCMVSIRRWISSMVRHVS